MSSSLVVNTASHSIRPCLPSEIHPSNLSVSASFNLILVFLVPSVFFVSTFARFPPLPKPQQLLFPPIIHQPHSRSSIPLNHLTILRTLLQVSRIILICVLTRCAMSPCFVFTCPTQYLPQASTSLDTSSAITTILEANHFHLQLLDPTHFTRNGHHKLPPAGGRLRKLCPRYVTDPVPHLAKLSQAPVTILRHLHGMGIDIHGTDVVYAAQCSNSATLTITASADASALASCTTYSGSVAIPTGLAVQPDGNGHQSLSVDGVLQKITGNLTVTYAAMLSSLSFSSLKSIGGFELGQLTVLSELSFPQLTTVGSLNFTALPALQQMSFGGTGISQADSILITNTGLSSLQGINNLQSVSTFNVNNNQALQNISLQVTSIKNSLDIEANDGYVTGLMTTFPMLETATNMTFRNCSSVSLPSLANVTQDLGFYGNTMQSFAAPNLTTVGGLIFVDNTELTNISLPQLTSVNASYQIANNTMLKNVTGFPKLSVVGGALDFNGNFTE